MEFELAISSDGAIPDTLYSGVVIKWDSLGAMVSRQAFLKGEPNGALEEWFPGGQRRVLSSFCNGKLDSSTDWNENGTISNRLIPGTAGDSLYLYDDTGKFKSAVLVEKIP